MGKFIISGFSDEIDEQITKQFEHLNKLGIEYFEPRGINGVNIADIDSEQLENLKADMKKYGSLPTPTREGYTFAGWYTELEGGTQITSDTIFNATSDQTLYAHWAAN